MRPQCERSSNSPLRAVPGSPSSQPAQRPCGNGFALLLLSLPNEGLLPICSQRPSSLSFQGQEPWKPFYPGSLIHSLSSLPPALSNPLAPVYALLEILPETLTLGGLCVTCSENKQEESLRPEADPVLLNPWRKGKPSRHTHTPTGAFSVCNLLSLLLAIFKKSKHKVLLIWLFSWL